MNDKIKVFALGGLDEDGKNLQIIEINNDIFVIECGIRFPDKTTPGIDYIIANYDYLKENKNKVKAYILLHGHDDEIGALAYIYKDVPAPIYCSSTTKEMFLKFLNHVGKSNNDFDFHIILPTSDVMIGGRKFSFFHTCHNIADSSGVAVDTSYGNIIYTGDFIIENNAEDRYLCDLNAIAKITEKPTILLMTESVYSNKQGYTSPCHKITPLILRDFEEAKGRIFVSLFSTNAYNIGEVFRLAFTFKKKIICYDSETQEVLETFLKTTGTDFPKGLLADLDDINRINSTDLVVLVCGYGANLYKKMSIIALGDSEDHLVNLNPDDTFIMAAPANVNVEVVATDAIDDLYRSGAKVINLSRQKFFRMHASEEDIKMMISLTKPKYYMPVKGAFRFLLGNAKLALNMGVGLSHQNVFVLDNGLILEIDEKGAHISNDSVKTGNLLIDGMGVADSNGKTMSERERLSADGVVILACTVSKSKREIVAGPDVQMRGFMFLKDADSILKTVTNIFVNTINEYLAKPSCNLDEARQIIYENCLKAIKKETNKTPVIMPLILEVID